MITVLRTGTGKEPVPRRSLDVVAVCVKTPDLPWSDLERSSVPTLASPQTLLGIRCCFGTFLVSVISVGWKSARFPSPASTLLSSVINDSCQNKLAKVYLWWTSPV